MKVTVGGIIVFLFIVFAVWFMFEKGLLGSFWAFVKTAVRGFGK